MNLFEVGSQSSSTGEVLLLLAVLFSFVLLLRKTGLWGPAFVSGVVFGGGLYRFAAGFGGGWDHVDVQFRKRTYSTSMASAYILIVLPDEGFDASTVAVPWKLLTDLGHKVVFATERGGKPAVPDSISLHGVLGGELMRPSKEVREAYALMTTTSTSFKKPLSFNRVIVSSASALIIPGGRHAGYSQLLENKVLRSKIILPMWKARKPVAAIGHGVLLLAQIRDPEDKTKSLLYHRNTAVLPRYLEMPMHYVASIVGQVPSPYSLASTHGEYLETKVAAELRFPNTQLGKGPWNPLLPFLHPSIDDISHAFYVEDGSYLSARYGGDAALIARRISSMLSPSGKCVTRKVHCDCESTSEPLACDEPLLNIPVQIREQKHTFLLFKGDNIETKARKFCQKYGGKYKDYLALDRDVQMLVKSARSHLENNSK